jgi:hypothetical protein
VLASRRHLSLSLSLWLDLLTAEGLNQTTIDKLLALSSPDAQAAKWVLSLGIRPLAFYHFINDTVTAGNLTNGQVLTTGLPTASLTVRLDPANAGNITFVGAANETDPAAPNTNVASILVKGYSCCGPSQHFPGCRGQGADTSTRRLQCNACRSCEE